MTHRTHISTLQVKILNIGMVVTLKVLNVSIICDTHVTRQSSIKLVETRFGNSNQNDNEVPVGL